jgi:hypothetical protein
MSTGKVKQLAFSEGVTVGTPSEIASQSVGFASYASEAAFVSAEGTAAAGDAFYDTTVQAVKYYNGSSWSVIGAGGAGEKNYIEAPSTATGWSNVGDLDVATTTTAADLPREYTTGSGIKITADSNTQSTADYVYYDFTLDDVDLNKKLKISWSQKTTGTYAAGDLAVVITTQADRTTALHTPITTAIPAADGVFTTSFDSGSTATLSLVIRATTDMATSGGIVISDVVVGPGIQPQGAVVGEWESWTPTGDWIANTTYAGRRRRVGGSEEYDVTVTLSGAPTTATLTLDLPSGRTIDTTKLSGTTGGVTRLGRAVVWDNGTATYAAQIAYNSTTDVTVRLMDDASGSNHGDSNVSESYPFTFASGDVIHANFTVPIAEWAGSGTLNVAQNDVEYAWNSTATATTGTYTSNKGYGPAGTAILAYSLTGTNAAIYECDFPTSIQSTDRIDLEVDDGSGRWMPYTTRIGGVSANDAGTTQYGAYVTVTGATTVRVNFLSAPIPGAAWSLFTGSSSRWRVVKSKAGQAVGFGNVAQSSAGLVKSAGQLLGTNTNDSAATGYVGEYLSTTLTYASRNGLVTNTTENVTGSAITLTAGDWDVQGVVAFEAAAATITNLSVGVSLTSATLPSSTTLAVPTSGEIYLAQAMATSVSGVGGVMTIPTYRVSVSASTPLYLVARAIFSAGTVECYGHVSARRVR